MGGPQDDVVIPLAEEKLSLGIRTIVTGETTVSIRTDTRSEVIEDMLTSEHIQISSVSIGRVVDEAPRVRQEGDVTIIPVIEEVFVKRLLLREELHVTRVRQTTPTAHTVELRRQSATVSRNGLTPQPEEQELP